LWKSTCNINDASIINNTVSSSQNFSHGAGGYSAYRQFLFIAELFLEIKVSVMLLGKTVAALHFIMVLLL